MNGGVGRQIVGREDHRVADLRADAVAALFAGEEALEARGGHVLGDGAGIVPATGPLDGDFVEIGGVDLKGPVALVGQLIHGFPGHHRDRIRLLAGGAPGDPDAKRRDTPLVREDTREGVLPQHLERVRLTEEARDADQEILEELPALRRLLLEEGEVASVVWRAPQTHPTLDPAQERAPLVVGQIVARALEDPGEDGLERPVARRRISVGSARDACAEVGHAQRELLGRADQIGRPRLDRAGGHRGVGRRARLLDQGDPPACADRLEAQRSIVVHSREQDAHRVLMLVGGDRAKELVDLSRSSVLRPEGDPTG